MQDCDGGDQAEPAGSRKQDNLQPATRKHRQSHNQTTQTALPDIKVSGPDRMAKSKRSPNITL